MLSVTILCITPESAQCSEPVYNQYRVNDGLPSNNIYCAMQDRDGFMWFGTDAGASRFDGIQFVNFSVDEGLCDNEILRISEDSKGRMWFLSLSGCLSYLENGVIYSQENDPSLAAQPNTLGTIGMSEDNEGVLWFYGMSADVIRFDGKATTCSTGTSEKDSGIRSGLNVHEDRSGKLYFLTSSRWCQWNGKSMVHAPGSPDFRLVRNRCFVRLGKGTSLAIVEEGIAELNNDAWKLKYSVSDYPQLKNAGALFYMQNNILGITQNSQKGIEFLLPGADGHLEGRVLFEREIINFAFADSDGNYWFCTAEHGVYCNPIESRKNFQIALPGDQEPYCALSIDDTTMVVGTVEGFLVTVSLPDRSSGKLFDTSVGQAIRQVAMDARGDIWAGSDRGLFRCNVKQHTSTNVPVRGLLYDIKNLEISAGNKLYLALLDGIYVADLNKSEIMFERLRNVPQNRVYAMCIATDGKIWFENNNQLMYVDAGLNGSLHEFQGSFAGRIGDITELPDKTLVVSTIGDGLYFIRQGKVIANLSHASGLNSDDCRKFRWYNGKGYVITSAGISSFEWNNGQVNQLKNYSVTDGIPAGKINDLLVNGNSMFVLSGSGLLDLQVEENPHQAAPPPIHLRSIFSNASELPMASPVRISYNQNLQLEYVGITFCHPEEIQYEYRWDELPDWVTTRNRSLEFSALSWGKHTLQLRARKYNSPWSDSLRLDVEILPPFYGTWWFRLGAIVFLAFAVYLLLRWLERRRFRKKLILLEQEQRVLVERNRISTDLHDDLGAELSNIVILSRIARSKMNYSSDAIDPVMKIDRAANEIINKMSGIIWSLNPANDSVENLVDYLRRYAQEFLEMHQLEGSIKVTGEVPRHEIKGTIRRNIFLVLKEALQNVFKHSNSDKVDVNIDIRNDVIRLEVCDSGKGFAVIGEGRHGLGLTSMKRRAEEVGGTLEITSEPGKGTSVVLMFPV